MRRTLTAVMGLAVLAVTLAAVAAAGPVTSKQRVAIEHHAGSSFTLTPLTPGAVQADSGIVSFCCWTVRHVLRDGEAIDINNPRMTLSGKRGTLVARNRVEFVDVPDGWVVFTGTWKVIRGTGQYAGLAGGGRGAGIGQPNEMARFEGFLGPK